ncbi:hypothetical protein [Cysteiniphilum sp. QT6929]|nr:hypothetical protein [Cysteiniphilum sp. QT6929]WHN64830.1 hypothetical protein NYP54_07180 [Cysteiniphilum sp. QT6929]
MKTSNLEKLPKITVYQNLTCWVVTLFLLLHKCFIDSMMGVYVAFGDIV